MERHGSASRIQDKLRRESSAKFSDRSRSRSKDVVSIFIFDRITSNGGLGITAAVGFAPPEVDDRPGKSFRSNHAATTVVIKIANSKPARRLVVIALVRKPSVDKMAEVVEYSEIGVSGLSRFVAPSEKMAAQAIAGQIVASLKRLRRSKD